MADVPSRVMAAQAEAAGLPLRLVYISMATPLAGEVLIRIMACGICHSDLHLVDGDWVNGSFPIIPGHEIAGVVEAIGTDVTDVCLGDRVGIPWIYSTCGRCDACKRGDDPLCTHRETTGLTVQGGYSEFIVAPARSVVKIPDNIPYHMAAPLFCAGLTSYSGLKLAAIKPGETVAIHGVGGLGHVAIQIARHFGARVIALTRSAQKRKLCEDLGADETIVAEEENTGAILQAAGGADVVFSCTPDPSHLGNLLIGLRGNGRIVIVGAGAGTMTVRPKDLIHRRLRIMGSPVGTHADMRETLNLAAAGVIHVKVKCYSLTEVNTALSELRNGSVHFRLVLLPSPS